MPDFISKFLVAVVDIVWGLPLVFLLIGGGLYLLLQSRFMPLLGFGHALKLVFGKEGAEDEKGAEGQITHLQALSNALAATVGLGNIAGVALAIYQGGPGAIFWMWVAALIGMNTKFFESSLAVMYRGKDYLGEVQGGPMYVIDKALPKSFRPFAVFFAVCGLLGCLPMFQANQMSAFFHNQLDWDPLAMGFVLAIAVGYVLVGGLKRLANVTSKLVPTMCLLYVLFAVWIIFNNWEKVPEVFALIFKEAFSGRAALGGVEGFAVLKIMQIGVKRAAFSNEAGVGTAPMAHGNAKTKEPISEGLVAMLGPFLDTIVVCTMTALVILTSLPPGQTSETSGVLLTLTAFQQTMPQMGGYLLGVAVFLFAFTTMLGMANYNEKCWNYLFKGRWIFGRKTFILFFCSSLVIGAISSLDDVINLLDIGYALMAIPNMLATLWLAPRVKREMHSYFSRHRLSRRVNDA